jgi:hypothetical protein
VNGGGTFAAVVLNAGGTAAFDTPGAQLVGALTVKSGGKAAVTSGAVKVGLGNTAAPLTIADGGTIDVGTRGLVVDTSGGNDTAAFQMVRASVIRAYDAGRWDGTGITSSSAVAENAKYAVGFALARDLLGSSGGSFMGQTADASSVVVRGTLAGDANLDGAVNFGDLVKLAQGYGSTDGSKSWVGGDFNYDGKVDFADLVKMAQNYGGSTPAGAAGVAGLSADFTRDWSLARASVPEPTALGIVLLGAAVLSRGRRARLM